MEDRDSFTILLIIVIPAIVSVAVVYRLGANLAVRLAELVGSLRGWRTYSDYLSSWVWRSKRARILSRDKRSCSLCSSRHNLQVHHSRYPRRWGMESDDDLTVLCSSCHRRYHSRHD